MSNPNPPVAAARAPRWVRWLLLAALAVYAVLLSRYMAVVAGGSDSSGYFNSARLLAAGKLFEDVRVPPEFGARGAADPMHFLPQGYFPAADRARLTPTYPTGLPLHFALAGKLAGWTAGPALVMLAAAIGAVALCYWIALELQLGRPLALAGSITLAVMPVFLFTSVQPLSDTLATTWVLAVVWLALRSGRARGWAVAAGGAFGMAVLVRPTNLLLAPAALVLLGWDWRRQLGFVIGGLPAAAWLAYYNHRLYGHPLRSGYGDIFAAFKWEYGVPTTLHFAQWLALLMPAALLGLPFVALTRRETRTRALLAFALGIAAVGGLYLFYEVSREVWWCLRFVLPIVPLLILAALLGVDALARHRAIRRSARFRHLAALGLAGWALALSAYWTPRLSVLHLKQFEEAYARGARAARAELPRDALVLGFAFTGALYYYTEYAVLRWDQLEAPAFARYAALAARAGRPVCAVLFESEEADAWRRCPGEWTPLRRVGNVGLWRLVAPAAPALP